MRAHALDVAVVGGGIIGLAAADALARRGADVVVLERGAPGAGQSAGAARGFRHLHATAEQIADAVRARALWDAWSVRAGEPLVGEEGALRLGGDVAADAARLRAAGVAATVAASAPATRHPALRRRRRPAAVGPARRRDPRRRARSRGCGGELGDRVRRADGDRGRAGPASRRPTARSPAARSCSAPARAPSGSWPHVAMRRVVHLRVTFAAPAGAAARTGVVGRRHVGGPERRASARAPTASPTARAASRSASPSSTRSPRRRTPPRTRCRPGVDLAAVRARLHAYARAAFPGLGAPVDEVVRLLTVLPGDDEDAYVLERRPGLTVVAGHNLFKLAPLLGEQVARAIM